MSNNCNDIRNEFSLSNGGTAQTDRQPTALRSDYVLVDERTFADWIVFARDYARFVQYYNSDNVADGNWESFWSANPAVILANLAAAPIDDFRRTSQLILFELQKLEYQDNTPASNLHLQEHFNLFFDLITTLAWQLDRHIQLLPDELPVKEALRSRISQPLGTALQQWIGWQKHAQTAATPLLDNGQTTLLAEWTQLRILGAAIVPTEDFYQSPPDSLLFSEDWLPEGATDWETYISGIAADDTVFGNDPAVPQAISFAIRHFFFTRVYEQFLQAFSLAVKEAEQALKQLLYKWNRHEPHFALFLAFLRLLQKEQAYLNTLTDRHLRFYYERVLRLQLAAAKPSRAFLTLELAKQVASHQLTKGTQFKAGKDATGQQILFELEEDFVANKAKVSELRSIFKAPQNPTIYQFGDSERTVYKNVDRDRYFASPVSNSADGLGEEDLETADGRWHPFGNRQVDADGLTWKMDMPLATIGFAIASNYLYLRQGTRWVVLKINGTGLDALEDVQFKASLTTEKSWLTKTASIIKDPSTDSYYLFLVIEADEDAILPYDQKVHEGDFQTSFPVLKAELINDTGQAYAYQNLKNLKVTGIDLIVAAGGKRDMALSGSTGELDGSKPFYPYGSAPGNGGVFILGDKEVFQKKSVIGLSLKWKDAVDTSRYYSGNVTGAASTTLRTLVNGNWSSPIAKNILPSSTTAAVNLLGGNAIVLEDDSIIEPDFTENTSYNTKLTSGFLRFDLSGDWGHAKYGSVLADYARNGGTLPNPLYDPQLLEVVLSYFSIQTISLTGSSAAESNAPVFYHLHPFGLAKRDGQSGGLSLFPQVVPQYNTSTPDGPVNNVGKDGGEWLIGIEGLVPPQVLSLLIQVAPGSADPLLEKPDPHVKWWYLQDNEWVPFKQEEISDGTRGLLQSGLIRFTVPDEANEDNTLLPKGKIWLRATVEVAVDAVNQIVGVHAQGCSVILTDNDNDPNLSALPLAAGTIAKLLNPQGAIKKVEQPYATFGGSGKEQPDSFYTRISERLRHKQRAITLWDYEHLLLQEFPQLHKVKCLNHLRYEPSGTQPVYRELAPGHVAIIPVTDTRNQNAVDPLRPYTSLADLEEIEAFLREHCSCFVQLHVRNPEFEPVLAKFNVRFFPGYDETFYKNLLNDEIVQFLSPWAFSETEEVEFGGKIYKAALVDFIEERPYVDYVEEFKLNHVKDPNQQNVEEVRPTKQVAILVSAREHDINVITSDPPEEWSEDCGCEKPLFTIAPQRPNLNQQED